MKKRGLFVGVSVVFCAFLLVACVSKAEYYRKCEEVRTLKKQIEFLTQSDGAKDVAPDAGAAGANTTEAVVTVEKAEALPNPDAAAVESDNDVLSLEEPEGDVPSENEEEPICIAEEPQVDEQLTTPLTIKTPTVTVVTPVGVLVRKPAARAESGAYPGLRKSLRPFTDTASAHIYEKGAVFAITVPGKVLFYEGDARAKKSGIRLLKTVAGQLKTLKGKHFRVIGHADASELKGKKASASYADAESLSVARAEWAMALLVQNGVNPADVSVVGYGDKRPLARNKGNAKELNRRLVIQIVEK